MFYGTKIFSNCYPLDTYSVCCCLGFCSEASNAPYVSIRCLVVSGEMVLILLILGPESFTGTYSESPNDIENKILNPKPPRWINIL